MLHVLPSHTVSVTVDVYLAMNSGVFTNTLNIFFMSLHLFFLESCDYVVLILLISQCVSKIKIGGNPNPRKVNSSVISEGNIPIFASDWSKVSSWLLPTRSVLVIHK